MIENFRVASATPEATAELRGDLHEDLMDRLRSGGVERLEADALWRMDAAALIRQVVVDTFAETDPTPLFTDRMTGEQGMTYEFEQLINTLRVVEYSPQSTPNIFTPRKGKYTIQTSDYELAYGIPLQKILNGQFTLGDFTQMAAEALVRHNIDLTLTAVDLACAVGATDIHGRALRTMAAGSDVAKSEIDAALKRMYSANSGLTIFGSRWALDAIYDAGATTAPDIAVELNTRGVIGLYRGARMVEVKDEYNLYYKTFTKVNGVEWEKLIFISSGQKGATLLEKDLSALKWNTVDTRKAQWMLGERMDHGILVHTPSRYHVIQLA